MRSGYPLYPSVFCLVVQGVGPPPSYSLNHSLTHSLICPYNAFASHLKLVPWFLAFVNLEELFLFMKIPFFLLLNDLYFRSLSDALQCPVCYDRSEHVFQCSQGHVVCAPCHSRLRACPVCRTGLNRPIRNLALEKLSQLL